MAAPTHTEGNTEQVTEEEKWEFLWFSEHKGFILGGGVKDARQTGRRKKMMMMMMEGRKRDGPH